MRESLKLTGKIIKQLVFHAAWMLTAFVFIIINKYLKKLFKKFVYFNFLALLRKFGILKVTLNVEMNVGSLNHIWILM